MIIIEPYLEKRPLKSQLMQALIVPIETEQSPTVAVLFERSRVQEMPLWPQKLQSENSFTKRLILCIGTGQM